MKSIIALLALVSSGLVCGQSFEGALIYVADFTVEERMEKMGLTKDIMIAKMKEDGSYTDTITVSYKQGNYRTALNTHPASWNIYTAASNRIHTMQDGEASDICTVMDASVDLEASMIGTIPTLQKLDTTVMLGGAVCNIVRVKWKTGTYDYYYDPTRLTVDASLFQGHVYDGWAEFLKISGVLPVQIVKTVKGMTTATQTLVSIKQEAIADELFTIPTLIPDEELNVIKVAGKELMRIKR